MSLSSETFEYGIYPMLHHIGKNYRYKMQPDDYDDAVIEAMCAIPTRYWNIRCTGKSNHWYLCWYRVFATHLTDTQNHYTTVKMVWVWMYRIFPMCSRTVICPPESPWATMADRRRIQSKKRRQKLNLLRLMVKDWPGKNATAKLYKCILTVIHLLEIGEAYGGVSGQRAFQVYSRAVRKIKDYWDRWKIWNRIELFNDHFQNYKVYGIPKAQLVLTDIPYNVGINAYGSNPSWYEGGQQKWRKRALAGKPSSPDTDVDFRIPVLHFCSKMSAGTKRKRPGKAPLHDCFCSFRTARCF